MSKYSSESDSSRVDDRSRRRNHSSRARGRSRSSSGSSSDSRYSYKRKSYRHKRSKGHRSRSRDRHGRSRSSRHHLKTSDSSHTLRSRSSSKGHSRKSSRDRSRTRDRSRSRERRSRSRDKRGRSRSRSHSRDRQRRRSRSKERSRYRSRSSSKNRSSSPEIVKQEPSTEEQLRAKLQRAIKAAQSADDQLRQQGLLTGSSTRKEDLYRDPPPPVYQGNIIDEINDTSFVQKSFTSSKLHGKETSEMPVIDLTNDTTTMATSQPPPTQTVQDPESIFHTSLNLDPQIKLDKWVKKLFHLRQKAINGEPLA